LDSYQYKVDRGWTIANSWFNYFPVFILSVQ